jgi:uncharacterized delta-60 repeat protein
MSLRSPRSRSASAALVLSVAALLLIPSTQAMAAPGALDTAFNGTGAVTTGIIKVDQAYDVAIDSSDRVVLGGFTFNGSNRDLSLVRYSSDGSLDSSFSSDGKVNTDVGGLGGDDQIDAITLQSNGKIVVAGSTVPPGGNADFLVARYNADGTLDSGFGGGTGYVTTDVASGADVANGVAIDSGGNIVVAGAAHLAAGGTDFAVARYTQGGVPDTSFDSDGLVTTAVGSSNDQANDVVVQSNDKIVAAGATTQGANNKDDAFVRYDTDGGLDNGFGSHGISIVSGTDKARAVTIDGSGSIVAAGSFYNFQTHTVDFGLVRLTSDGQPDGSFGSGGLGKVDTPMGKGGQAEDLAIDASGNIVAAGYASNGSDRDFALARYAPDGSLTTTFGNGGKVITPVGSPSDSGHGVGIDSIGRIVVGGYAFTGQNADFAAVRYLAAGYRPDALVKRASVPAYSGEDMYNTTGLHQTVMAKTKRGHTAQFNLRVQNDGTGTDSLAVKGCASSKGFTVTYLQGATDVTGAVTSGTYSVGPLGLSAAGTFSLSIKVAKRLPIGRIKSCSVSATSQTASTEKDVVEAKIKTTA